MVSVVVVVVLVVVVGSGGVGRCSGHVGGFCHMVRVGYENVV